jgi:ribonuclease P protein component
MKTTGPPLRGTNEANISTEQPTTEANPRLSRSHGYSRRSPSAEEAAGQGPQAANGQHSPQTAGLIALSCERFPKRGRIRKRWEFLRLQRVGRRRTGTYFVVITEPVTAGSSRLGITVSRRIGGAVVRNRVKRRVREFFRRHRGRIVPPQNVLVIGRAPAASATYAAIKQDLVWALKIDVRD